MSAFLTPHRPAPPLHQDGDVAAYECPASQSIICFVAAGWGKVAGSCQSCQDSCSTDGLTGSESCCGSACTQTSSFDFSQAAHVAAEPSSRSLVECDDNSWVG